MGHNLRTQEAVAIGEGEHRSFYEIIEASAPFGWMTFDQSILRAYEQDLITAETARLFASCKGRITRGIDLINYDVVVVYENFKGSTLQTNPILAELAQRPDAQRRQHFVVLISHRFATNDAMSAFVYSVDQVINITDLANLKPVLRRGVTQHHELYNGFNEMLKSVQSL